MRFILFSVWLNSGFASFVWVALRLGLNFNPFEVSAILKVGALAAVNDAGS